MYVEALADVFRNSLSRGRSQTQDACDIQLFRKSRDLKVFGTETRAPLGKTGKRIHRRLCRAYLGDTMGLVNSKEGYLNLPHHSDK